MSAEGRKPWAIRAPSAHDLLAVAPCLLVVLLVLLACGTRPAFSPLHAVGGRYVSGPYVSPDGNAFAFTAMQRPQDKRDPHQLDIFVQSVAPAGTERNLTHHPAYYGNVQWSPDGTLFYFLSDRDRALQLFRMRNDGTDLQPIVSNVACREPGTLESPSGISWMSPTPCALLSPDGKSVAFERVVPGADKEARVVVVASADGSDEHTLVNGQIVAWSSDAQWILYKSTDLPPLETGASMIRPNGSDDHRVLAEGEPIAWSPDAKTLVYVSQFDLYFTDLDGARKRVLENVGVSGSSFTFMRRVWNAPGTQLVLSLNSGFKLGVKLSPTGIVIFGRDGAIIADHRRYENPPIWGEAWSSDTEIWFSRAALDGPTFNGIFRMKADGTDMQRVVADDFRFVK